MRTIFRKILRLSVGLIMVLASFAMTPRTFGVVAMAEEDLTPGAIFVDKTRDDGNEGVYELTLRVSGNPPVIPSDIVLVMDVSSSMTRTKLNAAKNAANGFIDGIIGYNQGHRVAIVSFSSYPTIVQGLSSDKDLLKGKINDLSSSGGTHLEGGIKVAKGILDDSGSGHNKAIIVLSDGAPTYGYDFGNYVGPVQITGDGMTCAIDAQVSDLNDLNNYTFYYSNREGSGSSQTFNKNIGYSGTCPDTNVIAGNKVVNFDLKNSVIWQANKAQAAGYKMFTIGLEVNAAGADVLMAAQNSGYFSGGSADLSGIYNDLANKFGQAATDAIVTDQVGDNFKFIDGSAVYASGTFEYDLPTKTIIWTIGNIGSVGKVLKYKVRIDEDLPTGTYPTNEFATLAYTDISGHVATKPFPVPEVDVIHQEPIEYDIEYYISQGDIGFIPVLMSTDNFNEADAITPFVPAAQMGRSFHGWFTDQTWMTEFSDFDNMPAENVKVYGYWMNEKYTFTFNPNYPPYAVYAEAFEYHDDIVEHMFTRPGFDFVKWTLDAEGTMPYVGGFLNLPAENIYIYAQWKTVEVLPTDYILNYVTNQSGLMIPDMVFNEGDAITPPVPTVAGFNFLGWYADAGLTVMFNQFGSMPDHNVTVYADWGEVLGDEDGYVIKYVTNQPSITIPDAEFVEGEAIVAPKPTLEGYIFLGWYKDAALTEKFDEFDSMPGNNVIVYADWGEVLGDEDEIVDTSDQSPFAGLGLLFLMLGGLAILVSKKEKKHDVK